MKYYNAGPAYLKAPLLIQRWLKGESLISAHPEIHNALKIKEINTI